jgi:TolA-binding protein
MEPTQARGDQERRRPSEVLAHFVHTGRYVLWTILILAAVFLIGYFGWSEWNKKRALDSTMAAEAAQELYDQWSAESNADKKATLEKQLMERVDRIVAKYPRQYGGERSLFMRANLFYQQKEWEKAAKDYQELAKSFPESYLAPISLFDAGVCLEQRGDKDGAAAAYMKVVDGYADSAIVPRALFDAARLDEAKGAFDQAQKKYEQLGSDYPQSGWTKLANNRIIALKVEGKIKQTGN